MAKEDNKPSFFSKVVEAGNTFLDAQIHKARAEINAKDAADEEEFYAKAVTDDPTFKINSQGYKEKPHRLLDQHLKQMSLKNSIVSSVIQTRQNQVSSHSKLVKTAKEHGFMIKLKDEEHFLGKIKEKLKAKMETSKEKDQVAKADPVLDEKVQDQPDEKLELQDESNAAPEDKKQDDEAEKFNWELERRAREKLEEQIKDRRKVVEEFILQCGDLEGRPFETKKWNFDTYLRAIVRDSLTYDRICTEIVPNNANQPSYFMPIDASTVKTATPDLKNYKTFPAAQSTMDFMYPEKQVEALTKDRDVVNLDEKLLEAEMYKFVQVVRGRIERAYTADEMKIGMRNMTTDIYNNGYSIAELELMVGLVSSHLNAEFYNQAYFTQGFSAKGILHLKAPINRRKLETVRQQWQHMLKGSRNSFQTPIFAGMDDVNWIPLTQNHSDIEFQGWMHYLIKMICAVYQIDPQEIGIGMRDEGKGGGISGDNTQEKIKLSKDKGLKPLLRFLENYININIVDMIDADFCIEFVGLDDESSKETLERQASEAKFKKTVNEIRAEDGLPPLPGMDDVILGPEYIQWYTQFSEKAVENQSAAMGQQNLEQGNNTQQGVSVANEVDGFNQAVEDSVEVEPEKEVSKSLKIEYYRLGD